MVYDLNEYKNKPTFQRGFRRSTYPFTLCGPFSLVRMNFSKYSDAVLYRENHLPRNIRQSLSVIRVIPIKGHGSAPFRLP